METSDILAGGGLPYGLRAEMTEEQKDPLILDEVDDFFEPERPKLKPDMESFIQSRLPNIREKMIDLKNNA